METTLASTILTRARKRTDTETPTPTDDFITDAFLLDELTVAYKKLVDMILSASGESGVTALAVSTTLAQGVTTLPVDLYRLIDVRVADGDQWAPLPTANWRNRHRGGTSDYPVYTQVKGELVFDPPTVSTGTVQVWYIPTVTTISTGATSLSTFGGWDDYLVACLCRQISIRSDLPAGEYNDEIKESSARIKQAARDLKLGHTKTLAQVETYAEDYFGWR